MKKLFFLLLPCLFFVPVAESCSCIYPTFEEQMKSASVVFSGKVISVETLSEERTRIAFKISKSFKGNEQKTISVTTAADSAMCGFPFKQDQEYLVFASGEKELTVGLCSLTKKISEAAGELKKLTPPQTTRETTRDPFNEMRGDTKTKEPLVPRTLNVTNAVIVGITKKQDGYVALIRATNNKVYFLKVGDKLHDGVVLKIDNNTVTFRQYRGYRSVLVRKELRPFPDE